MQLRQGDVFLCALSAIPPDQIQYESIPADAVAAPRGPHGVLLAAGKTTGHHHAIASEEAELFVREGVRFLRARTPVALTHEEHSTIMIPAGEYRVTGHHEYEPGELPRQVED